MILCPRNKCTGCAACYNACAFSALRMAEDELGTLKPQIDEEQCTNCGKCAGVCPVLNPAPRIQPRKCYALVTLNEVDRVTCSSGGAATAFARKVIRSGGAVYGAAYDEKGFPTLKKAVLPEELEQFKGSKYTYAFPGLVYRDIENELKKGTECLFIGLPCQVDGLRHFIGKDMENLVTVDLICHGAPPSAYLHQHIRSTVGIRKAKNARAGFRGKRDFVLTILSDNGETLYARKSGEDAYFHAFLSGLIHRDICYSCPYAQAGRVSDITVGDFWGLDKNALNGYAGKVSVALLNTQKGVEFLNGVLHEFTAEEREVAEAVAGNDQLRAPSKAHDQRDSFRRSYMEKGFTYAVSRTDIGRQARNLLIRNKILWLPRKFKRILKG